MHRRPNKRFRKLGDGIIYELDSVKEATFNLQREKKSRAAMATKRLQDTTGSVDPAASAKRPRESDGGPSTIPALQPLPADLLLEVAARMDVMTVLRCAATSKPLRRAILDPGFRRLLDLRAASGGFGPALLLGFSYRVTNKKTKLFRSHVVENASPRPRPRLRIDEPSLLESLEPVASRDGLLVLRRDGGGPTVCDTLTGDVTSLPPTGMSVYYPPAVLAVGGGSDRSFELLVVDRDLRIQTLLSKNGRWGAVRAVTRPAKLGSPAPAHPAVVGRAVHWLCLGARPRWPRDPEHYHVLAVDVDAAEATKVRLPPRYSGRMFATARDGYLRLVTVGGRLSLVVAESFAVSVWTLTSAPAWSRHVVISTVELVRRTGLPPADPPRSFCPMRLLGFGERSGVVVLEMRPRELVYLNLGTKAVTVARHASQFESGCITHVCLHEVGLASLLQDMKYF
ncbi:hypothetical protein ACP70R_024401 [Stipagrostis hirtigluma subsp. patula]